jgi:hypothetical protein
VARATFKQMGKKVPEVVIQVVTQDLLERTKY